MLKKKHTYTQKDIFTRKGAYISHALTQTRADTRPFTLTVISSYGGGILSVL